MRFFLEIFMALVIHLVLYVLLGFISLYGNADETSAQAGSVDCRIAAKFNHSYSWQAKTKF